MNTATLVFLIASLLGFVTLILGVLLLAGEGWALIATACSFFMAAAFLRKGMTGG